MPDYRFNYLLQKAFELCSELKGFGEQLLALKEKQDDEALSVLRTSQDRTISDMTPNIKKFQKGEATRSIEAPSEEG